MIYVYLSLYNIIGDIILTLGHCPDPSISNHHLIIDNPTVLLHKSAIEHL